MTQQTAIELAIHAMTTTMIVAAPFLLAGLVVGVLVSIFQAITSIQEPTLSFVPKILAVGAVIAVGGPWMLSQLIGYAHEVLLQIPTIGAG
ncbi:MAG: flagellar biosynthesis protein FliQ [Actinobacteria bacterium]|nr:flagellar biosynthesis protein FliQ [Actinomycetota bacterium]MBV8561989.1 flagellar biosynthesis protein FliQ [Actinomycetota bacterium]